MVTITVESRKQAEFLQTALEHAWKINGCNADDIHSVMEQVDALDVTNQTLKLSDTQVEAFRIIMQLYCGLSADFVEWSGYFIKQLPAKVKDAPRFHAMLRDFYLGKHAKKAYDLFKYWITQDWAYFNSVLLDLIDSSKDLDWMCVMHWCRSNSPSNTEADDEIAYYNKEYCK